MPIAYTPELVSELKSLVAGLPRPAGVKAVQKRLKLSERQARFTYAKYFGETVLPHQQPPGIKVDEKDGNLKTEVKTHKVSKIEDVVALCQVDSAKWETRGFSVSQNRTGEFVWRASFKPGAVSASFVEDLKADLKEYAPKPVKIKRAAAKGGRLLEIALFDTHLGKLGWSPEVGADYDIKIARDTYMAALNELIAKAVKQGPVARVLFPVGNDYLTIDSDANETTAGTKQDVDSRFSKIYREGRKMLVEAVEILRQVAPVDVVVVCGNHDNVSMFHLGDALECWFHDYEDVKIFNEPISRKYYQFGKNMLCFCHGHQEKHQTLPNLAAQEQPAMWAATTTREFHVGHWHHVVTKEYMGFNVRILSSLSGPDRYHHDHGYVGAKRTAQAFLFNDTTGLEAIFESTAVTA